MSPVGWRIRARPERSDESAEPEPNEALPQAPPRARARASVVDDQVEEARPGDGDGRSRRGPRARRELVGDSRGGAGHTPRDGGRRSSRSRRAADRRRSSTTSVPGLAYGAGEGAIGSGLSRGVVRARSHRAASLLGLRWVRVRVFVAVLRIPSRASTSRLLPLVDAHDVASVSRRSRSRCTRAHDVPQQERHLQIDREPLDCAPHARSSPSARALIDRLEGGMSSALRRTGAPLGPAARRERDRRHLDSQFVTRASRSQ